MVSFHRPHFVKDILLTCVRRYVANLLSYRHMEQLMHQRGVSVDNATVDRSVVKYSPQSKEAFHRRKHLVWVRWQVWSSCRGCGKVN
jgi:putative transposase